jgi:alpha-glucuronidase
MRLRRLRLGLYTMGLAFMASTVWTGGATAEEPFQIRGWDLERYDPPYVIEMIDRAHQAGMNTITLSHEIVMNAEEIVLDWHRYQHLQRFCEEAHQYGMKVFFWNHQINNPPEVLVSRRPDGGRSLDFDNPLLTQWLYDRYQRVCDRVPQMDGIVLSLTESEWQVQRDASDPEHYNAKARIVSQQGPAQRMAKVINTIADSLRTRSKQLIVRDFLRSPREMAAFVEALKNVPAEVVVYTKCVPNDWQYRYPPHPLLGKVAPHLQIMELDLYTETGGNIHVVMPAPAYYQAQLRLARERGLVGAIARVDDGFSTNRGTPAEFNVLAYSRLLHDPDADVRPMWREFFEPFYGPVAAPVAVECLQQCFDLTCAVQYTLGFWTGAGGRVRIAYTDDHLLRNSSALWSDDPKYKATEKLLLDSGPEAIRQTVEEKRQAEERAARCLARLDAARDRFTPERFRQIRGYFEEFRQRARIGRIWAHAYFALRWYRNTRQPEARAEAEAALSDSEAFVRNEHVVDSDYVRAMNDRRQSEFFVRDLPSFNLDMRKAIDAVATGQ